MTATPKKFLKDLGEVVFLARQEMEDGDLGLFLVLSEHDEKSSSMAFSLSRDYVRIVGDSIGRLVFESVEDAVTRHLNEKCGFDFETETLN